MSNHQFHKAVFLDKDGTLVEDVPYNVLPALIRLLPGVVEGLRSLHRAGYLLIVITNQAGVALGKITEQQIDGVRKYLVDLLMADNIPLAGFYFCPHHPDGTLSAYTVQCGCRKPRNGMVLKAAMELRVNLLNSWFVGDILDDIEAGNRSGCRTILLDRGSETKWVMGRHRTPDFIARDFTTATLTILNDVKFDPADKDACHGN